MADRRSFIRQRARFMTVTGCSSRRGLSQKLRRQLNGRRATLEFGRRRPEGRAWASWPRSDVRRCLCADVGEGVVRNAIDGDVSIPEGPTTGRATTPFPWSPIVGMGYKNSRTCNATTDFDRLYVAAMPLYMSSGSPRDEVLHRPAL